ncbi:glycosyltransferase family 4 protein [Egicoccus sp. AB-alg6-2]|uniref:glycosyltransferase family 4 protein n=1 Tax=Egicoccus sp. AB-alg6-2 TaxID=3242692 RepID=UPI00359E6704
MRVLLLTWEYPPRVVGGLGRHCVALARNLVARGHEVHVVTRDHPEDPAPAEEWLEGVHVVRVTEAPPVIPFDDLVPWVLAFNNRVQAAAAKLARRHDFDVVHAHDWLVAYAAAGIKDAFELPLVATVHATEYGRHQGWLPGPMNKLIHQVEWWLTYEARRVITCSDYMRGQVEDIFALPPDKIDVVPNGVAVRDFALPATEVDAFRRTLVGPRTRMVLFAGRLEYEKGVQTVLEALQNVRGAVGPVKFFIAGIGTYSDELRRRVRELGLRRHVHFTGFLEDHELRLHYAAADVAVAPSIYEPFGLVAVEAMACGTPVVAGDTGGLREIVAGGSGLSFPPQDADELAAALVRVLTDDGLAQRMVARARRRIADRYDWSSVAAATVDVYGRAADEEAALAGREQRPALRALLHAAPILEFGEAAG